MEVDRAYDSYNEEEIVWRPPLLGVSSIPTSGKARPIPTDKPSREMELTRQISELVKARRLIRRDRDSDPEEDGRSVPYEKNWNQPRDTRAAPSKLKGPRLVSNVQLVPPRDEEFPPLAATLKGLRDLEKRVQATAKNSKKCLEAWTIVGKKKGTRHGNSNAT